MRLRRLALLLVLSLLALGMAACGSDDWDAPAPALDDSAPAAAAPAASGGDDWDAPAPALDATAAPAAPAQAAPAAPAAAATST